MQILGHAQGVADAVTDRADRSHVEKSQFGVQKTDVESGVVDDQFGAAHKVEKLDRNVGEARFVDEKLAADPVHRQSTGVDIPFRVQVAVEMPVGQTPIEHLDTGDLDDAVSELVLQAGGFSIEKDLAHQ